MLLIRKQQMDALNGYTMSQYEQRVIRHLKTEFADFCANKDDEQLKSVVQNGIERAHKYDFISEQDICLYIDITVLHGQDFDSSPDYPMSGDILRRKNITHRERLERLITYLGDQSQLDQDNDTLED